MTRLLRVQDKSGRGPWRPGFSNRWLDNVRDFSLPPIFDEIQDFDSIVARVHRSGWHIGCAARGGQFSRWFTSSEIAKLKDFGFRLVNATPCTIVAETPNQVVIVSPRPLARLTRLPWSRLQYLEDASD